MHLLRIFLYWTPNFVFVFVGNTLGLTIISKSIDKIQHTKNVRRIQTFVQGPYEVCLRLN